MTKLSTSNTFTKWKYRLITPALLSCLFLQTYAMNEPQRVEVQAEMPNILNITLDDNNNNIDLREGVEATVNYTVQTNTPATVTVTHRHHTINNGGNPFLQRNGAEAPAEADKIHYTAVLSKRNVNQGDDGLGTLTITTTDPFNDKTPGNYTGSITLTVTADGAGAVDAVVAPVQVPVVVPVAAAGLRGARNGRVPIDNL